MTLRPTLLLPVQSGGDIHTLDFDGTVAVWDAANQTSHWDIIIPGQSVRIYSHDLPKMCESERLNAARFFVEDRIGAALENQHIVLSDARIAVVQTDVLRLMIERVEKHGSTVDNIYADFDWLGKAGTLRLADRTIITGPEGYTLDPEWAEEEHAGLAQTAWADIQHFAHKAQPISLRRGIFSEKTSFTFPRRGLSSLAALVLIAGLVWLGHTASKVRALNSHTQFLRSENAALYTEATGKAAPNNPALTITRALKTTPKSASGFLSLSARFNHTLATIDGVVIDSLSYDAAKSELKLRLVYPDFDAADKIEQAAKHSGGIFKPGGIAERNGVLIGDARFMVGGKS